MARIADEHAPSFIISTGQHAVAYRPPCLILAKFRQFVACCVSSDFVLHAAYACNCMPRASCCLCLLGDNFYESGLLSVDDTQFTTSFTDVYNSKSLQARFELPWITLRHACSCCLHTAQQSPAQAHMCCAGPLVCCAGQPR